ncbi:hypothetical protein M0R45_006968 [Rubus argutus]|uniref:Uncharacterized protein n=1 Tax=Rubus argutus TaxID=59490 RepID=A0AAW1YS19_RUBAR
MGPSQSPVNAGDPICHRASHQTQQFLDPTRRRHHLLVAIDLYPLPSIPQIPCCQIRLQFRALRHVPAGDELPISDSPTIDAISAGVPSSRCRQLRRRLPSPTPRTQSAVPISEPSHPDGNPSPSSIQFTSAAARALNPAPLPRRHRNHHDVSTRGISLSLILSAFRNEEE